MKTMRVCMLALLLLLGLSLPSRAADAPLRLEAEQQGASVVLRVVTGQPITLASYDFQFTWDEDALTLTEMENSQSGFSAQENPEEGLVSAMSGNGRNLSLEAGETLVTLRFALVPGAEGEVPLSLTVEDVGNEMGESFSWRGDTVRTALVLESVPEAAILSLSRADAQLQAEAYCLREGGKLYCAAYGVGGRMLLLQSEALTDSPASCTFQLPEATRTLRLFILDTRFCPLCESRDG